MAPVGDCSVLVLYRRYPALAERSTRFLAKDLDALHAALAEAGFEQQATSRPCRGPASSSLGTWQASTFSLCRQSKSCRQNKSARQLVPYLLQRFVRRLRNYELALGNETRLPAGPSLLVAKITSAQLRTLYFIVRSWAKSTCDQLAFFDKPRTMRNTVRSSWTQGVCSGTRRRPAAPRSKKGSVAKAPGRVRKMPGHL